jgi:hypothetical protein
MPNPAVSDACFKAQFSRLADNYLSGAEEALVKRRRGLYAELLGRHEWITDAVFRRAVQETLDTVQRFLPGTAEFLAICEFVKGEIDRAAHKALPPPAPRIGSRPSNDELLRHIAIGKLRARHTNTKHSWLLSDNGFQPDSHPFTEDQINAVLAEMERRREYESLRTLPEDAPPLHTLAALGVPPPAPVAEEWPQAVAHHGTNGDTR